MAEESDPSDFADRLAAVAELMEAALDAVLPATDGTGMAPARSTLHAAMRYATLGPGKRFRSYLLIAAADMFGVARPQSCRAAAAVECVHAYSLLHDDLPAMDGDDMRRGMPTGHRAFGEATAILAGDALQSLAFSVLLDSATHPDTTTRADLVGELAEAIGASGMAGGQAMDLQPEAAEARIQEMQERKTGALIRYSCWAGGRLGTAEPEALQALTEFGQAIGQAYQIRDDLLDVEGDERVTGKRLGKDESAGKQTLLSCLGVDGARSRLIQLCNMASARLEPFGAKAAALAAATAFVGTRDR